MFGEENGTSGTIPLRSESCSFRCLSKSLPPMNLCIFCVQKTSCDFINCKSQLVSLWWHVPCSTLWLPVGQQCRGGSQDKPQGRQRSCLLNLLAWHPISCQVSAKAWPGCDLQGHAGFGLTGSWGKLDRNALEHQNPRWSRSKDVVSASLFLFYLESWSGQTVKNMLVYCLFHENGLSLPLNWKARSQKQVTHLFLKLKQQQKKGGKKSKSLIQSDRRIIEACSASLNQTLFTKSSFHLHGCGAANTEQTDRNEGKTHAGMLDYRRDQGQSRGCAIPSHLVDLSHWVQSPAVHS